jgi:hypothetical protein
MDLWTCSRTERHCRTTGTLYFWKRSFNASAISVCLSVPVGAFAMISSSDLSKSGSSQALICFLPTRDGARLAIGWSPAVVAGDGRSIVADTGPLPRVLDGARTLISRMHSYDKMFTALAATSAKVSSEIPASAIIKSLARADSGSVSVGEKAVALVKERNR